MTNNLDPRYNLDNYKMGYNGYFNNVLDDQFPHYYYKKIINSWKQKRLDELQNNELLKDRYNLCEWYIGLIAQFMTQTVRAFKSIKEYYENQHAYSAQELRARSNHPRIEISNLIRLVEVDLMNYEDSIRLNKIEGNLRCAYSLQQFVLTITGNALKTLKHPLQINVDQTPLHNVIGNYLTVINNTMIPEEIQHLDNSNNKKGKSQERDKDETNITLEEIRALENSFIRSLPMSEVITKLSPLKKLGKMKSAFLNDHEFNQMLLIGFVQREGLGKIQLNITSGYKKEFIKPFKALYEYNKGNGDGSRNFDPFILLIMNTFEGWSESDTWSESKIRRQLKES